MFPQLSSFCPLITVIRNRGTGFPVTFLFVLDLLYIMYAVAGDAKPQLEWWTNDLPSLWTILHKLPILPTWLTMCQRKHFKKCWWLFLLSWQYLFFKIIACYRLEKTIFLYMLKVFGIYFFLHSCSNPDPALTHKDARSHTEGIHNERNGHI